MVYNPLKTELSPRMFPIHSELENYLNFVDTFPEKDTRMVLKLILMSGVRFSESINSFILYDNKTNRHAMACYALKRSDITQFKLGHNKAVHIKRLQADLAYHPERFKTISLLNLFNIDKSEVFDCSNDMDTEPNMLRPFSSYLSKKYHLAFYRALHKFGKGANFRVYYLNTKLSGIERDVRILPSFHFYRKLFASELYRVNKDVAGTVEFMKWKDIRRFFDYVKMYNNNSEEMRRFQI